ncbi:MAG: DUF4384 domain-containing protein [Desulfobulbaceae bacterium]|nr:MAG: DUF4384 domain-containing protein [Desulfobulbaceae bacterium]
MLRSRLQLIALLLICLFWTGIADLHADAPVEFKWALLMDTPTGLSAVDFSSTPEIAKGATLQLYLKPEPSTYLYLFLLDSSNVFTPIFPGSQNYYAHQDPGKEIRIPAGENRFTIVPPPGQEKFYLLASPKRLVKLEKLIDDYLYQPDSINTQAELFKEVRLIRRAHSKFKQFTETGMPVSGTRREIRGQGATRGSGDRETFVATHVSAVGFYSRILRVNHE